MKLSYRHLTVDVPLRVLRRLKARMRFVRAAGGVVRDSEGNMLLIRRGNHWDLPKGKVEEGESVVQGALREVMEETGLKAAPGGFIVKTYHCYNLYGGWHLKQTFWYNMTVPEARPATTPQAEEGITEAVWVEPRVWRRRMRHSFGTMRIIARRLR